MPTPTEITLSLKYHAGQTHIFDHPARRKVVAKGRRWGFTRGAAQHVIEQMLEGISPVLWGDTVNANITSYVERYFIPVLSKLPSAMWQWKKQEKKLIINQSVCDFRSADQPENWEGFGYRLIILNEAGIILKNQYLWHNAVRPMLMDYPDSVAIIGGCVSEDTRILPRGGSVIIGSMSHGCPAQTYEPCQVDLYGREKAFHTADNFFYNGVTETRTITTKAGFRLEASLWHPVLCADGAFRRMSDLQVGEMMAIDYGMQVWGDRDPLHGFEGYYAAITDGRVKGFNTRRHPQDIPSSMDDDFAYVMGLWLAEGSVERVADGGKYRVTITCGDQDVEPFLLRFGFHRCRKDQWRINSHRLYHLMTYIGMPMVTAKHKTIPQWVWNGTAKWAANFISGFFDGDGHVRNDGRRELGFSSSSSELLRGLQLVLSNMGAVSRLSSHVSKPTKRVAKTCVEYQLAVYGMDFEVLQKVLEPRIRRKRSLLKSAHITQRSPSTVEKERMYYHDQIVSIAHGERMTYDFTIPETHSFWTNGFISHNTPKGKNLFHELFSKSGDGWKSFTFSSYANPFIQRSEIEAMEKELPDSVVRQEIYAEFMGEGDNVLIPYDLIMACVNRTPLEAVFGNEIWGLDVARQGDDFSVLAKRHYLQVHSLKQYSFSDTMQLVGAVNTQYQDATIKPRHVFVESTFQGWAIADRLRELGVPAIGADPGAGAVDPSLLNKRAEMYVRMMKSMRKGLALPNHKGLIKQLSNVYIEYKDARLKLVAKEKIKQEIGESPDHADAVALTFFEELPVSTDSYVSSESTGRAVSDYDPMEARA